MTWGNYMRACTAYQRKGIEELRKLRVLLSAITGQDQKAIIELPGDWDHVRVRTKEEILELATKFKVREWVS
jgi:hypothetical protein